MSSVHGSTSVVINYLTCKALTCWCLKGAGVLAHALSVGASVVRALGRAPFLCWAACWKNGHSNCKSKLYWWISVSEGMIFYLKFGEKIS